MMFLMGITQAQTLIYSENFETNSLPDSVVLTGTGTSGSSSALFSQGVRSDSMRIALAGDSVVMTTQAFSTTGNSFVMLYFDQICKIEFFDEGYIEVSNNNGVTWTRLTAAQYQGISQFGTQGDKFTAAAYANDWAAGSYAVPSNAWWKSETFDISLLVGNAAQVKIRFVLRDAQPGSVMPDNYAWFLDNIRVVGAFSELNPPILTMIPPIVQDTVYSTGPYLVKAVITDQSLIDTAYVKYWVNTGSPVTLGMTRLTNDTFQAFIPFFGFGKNIHYYVEAVDGSAAHNVANSATYHFYCKFSTGGTFTLGTGTTANANTNYPAPYGNWYYGAKHQFIILASELLALGAPGGAIGSLAFDVATVQGTALQNFYIKMGHTTLTAATTTFVPNLTQVYSVPSYTDVAGWNTHTFQTPFVWNGTDNLVVEVCFNNSSYTNNASTYYTATPFVSCVYYNSDASGICATTSAYSTSSNRPNMKIEILGVSSLTLDAGVGQIVYPTGGVVANTSFAVTAQVKNYGTDTLLSATVNWRLDGVLQTPYAWTGSLLKDSSSSVITLGTINLAQGVHDIIAWTDNPNGQPDLNTGNDSSKISFMACANLLAGTYTVGGTNPDFADINAAIIALTQCGISAPVTFNVAPGTYTGQYILPWISGSSATNTVTFKAANNDSTSVILQHTALNTASNYIMKLDGAMHIILKNLKWSPGSTTFGTALLITNGAQNNLVQGCHLTGNPGTTEDLAVIRLNGALCHSNQFIGNYISGGSYGIYAKGGSTAAKVNNITATGNVIEGFDYTGIRGEFVDQMTSTGNTITSAVSSTGQKEGIHYLYGGADLKVLKNKIVMSNGFNTNAINFENCTTTVATQGLIANNFVSITSGTSNTFGIRIQYSSYQRIYHNSVYVNGTSSTATRGINPTGTSSQISVLNNIVECNFYPTLYEGTSVVRSNYNNFYSSTNLYGYYTTAYINFSSLAALKAATQMDTNSVSTIPLFVGTTDLHTFNGLLNGIATPLAEVTDDIDGELRDLLVPDPGADEFTPSPYDAAVITITSAVSGCGYSTQEDVIIEIKNAGSVVINGNLTAYYQILGASAPVSEPVTTSIQPASSIQFTFSNKANLYVDSLLMDSVFTFKAWVVLTGDIQQANDTANAFFTSSFAPYHPIVNDTTVPFGSSVTLPASSYYSVYWYDSLLSVNNFHVGSTYTTPVLYGSTTYYVEAKTSSFADSMLYIASQSNVYTSSQTRGYHFTAPVDMTIMELMVPTTVTSGGQYIQVVKFNGYPLSYPNGSTFTTLAYIQNAPFGVAQQVNIPVMAGDQIGIIGASNSSGTTMHNSYGPAQVASSINGIPVTLRRLVYQSPLSTGAAASGSIGLEQSSSIARVEMKYRIGAEGCPSDRVPLNVFVGNPPPLDLSVVTINTPVTGFDLTATEPVTVVLRNFGTQTISNFQVGYNINGGTAVVETVAGPLATNAVMNYTFTAPANLSAYQIYDIKAFAKLTGDTIVVNDTAQKTVENKMLIFCQSAAQYAGYEEIVNVTLNTLNNTSVANMANYTDYTATVQPTVLSPGSTYPVSVSSGFPPGYTYQYSCYTKAWIDFNHDAVFDPVTEMIFGAATTSSNTVSGTFTVPANAAPGIQRLRVVLSETSTASQVTPCGLYSYGETEDYVVMIAPSIPYDAGVTSIINPTVTQFLTEGDTIPVLVEVTNFGTDTLTALSAAYTINNGTPVVTPFTGLSIPQFGKDTLTLPSFICPPGTFTLCAYTILTGDSNAFNDQTCKTLFGNPQVDLWTYQASSVADGCNLAMDTIRMCFRHVGGTPITGGITANYQVNGGPVVTEPLAMTMNPGDSSCYTFTTLYNFAVTTVDSVFTIKTWAKHVNDGVQVNDTALKVVKSLHTPASPTATAITVPYGTTALVSAVSPTNDTLLWYKTASGGNFFTMGSSFTTGILYNDTTFYVEAVGAVPYQTFTLGTGTLQNTSTSYPTPYGNYYWGNKEQYLLLASELTALGMVAGEISSLAFDVAVPEGTPLQNFTIKMGATTLTAMTMQFIQTGLSTVYTTSSYSDVSGWNVHAFQSPFQWDGVSNIVVEVCFNNSNYTNNGIVKQTTTSFVSTTHYNQDASGVCGNTSGNNTFTKRPNMQLVAGANGCSSSRVPVQVFVSGQQPCDLGIVTILQPTTAVNLTANEDVKVRVQNFGTAAQSNYTVSYQIDNQPVITETITASLAASSFLDYTFAAKANLANTGVTYQIKAWATIVCDSVHVNDTAWRSVTNLIPSYCPSSATSPAYEDLTNVTLHTLNNTSAAVGSMYTNFTQTVLPPVLSPGMTYPMSISTGFPPGYSYAYSCWVKAYIDFDRDGTLDPVNEMIFSMATTSSNTVNGTCSIPATALPGNTLMRVVFVETSSASSVNPCGTYSWGETEDYMVTISPQGACDAGVIAVMQPVSPMQAGLSSPVWVKFMNFGTDTIQTGTLSLGYIFNNGTPVITPYPGSLAPMATDSMALPNVTPVMGNNTLCVYTILACDSTTFNNQICKNIYGQYSTTVPYFDDFETSNLWYKPDVNSNWQYGTPAANVIDTAYSGTKVWATNLTGDYTNGANDYLYTPMFDFSSLGATDTVTLSFYHWLDMATNDYGHLQYSLDGGANWANLGFMADPMGTNWYNAQSGGTHYFSLTNTGWQYSAYKLQPGIFNLHNEVQFRFRLSTNSTGTANGWALDNFNLALPLVPNDVGVMSIDSPVNDTATGSNASVTVTLMNFGTNVQTSIPVVLKLNGVTIQTGTFTGTLQPQATTLFTFPNPFTVPATAHQLCAETQLTGDIYTINDGKCKNFNPLPALVDVGVLQIVSPLPDSVGRICFYHAAAQPWYQFTVRVLIRNFGQNTQTSIPLKYSFSTGGTVYTDTWTGTLAQNSQDTFNLTTLFLPVIGAQQVCVETDLGGDAVSTNNKGCLTYTGVQCTGIDDYGQYGFILHQNVPNPFSQRTLIEFETPTGGLASLSVVNAVGQPVYMEQKQSAAGIARFEVDAGQLAAGVYYYSVEINGVRQTRKMVIRK